MRLSCRAKYLILFFILINLVNSRKDGLPDYNCKHIPSVHGRFNNLLGDNLHSKKTLETLHSLYDFDIITGVTWNSFNANINPDFNFLEPRLLSRYFSPHSFAETIKSKMNENHRSFISILHSNIRSLRRNFEQFLGLTEIRIRDGVCNENLPSLTQIRKRVFVVWFIDSMTRRRNSDEARRI